MSNLKKFFGTPTKEANALEPLEIQDEVETVEVETLPAAPPAKRNTVIAKGQILDGNLGGDGAIQVEGCVKGSVAVQGTITVTSTGLIEGPIQSDVIRIAGRVTGSITAKRHLRLERTASVNGDISTASLVVDDGAQLEGCCTMLAPPTANIEQIPEKLSAAALQFGDNYVPEKEETKENGEKAKQKGNKR